MRKQMKGYGFYLIILAIVIMTVYVSDNFNTGNKDEYSKAQLIEDVQGDRVKSVDIYQNEEVPSGKI